MLRRSRYITAVVVYSKISVLYSAVVNVLENAVANEFEAGQKIYYSWFL